MLFSNAKHFRHGCKLSYFGNNFSPSALYNRKYIIEEYSSEARNKSDKAISWETSKKYLESSAYQKSYNNLLVWEQYRNHKGLFPPKKTRKTCIRKGVATGNPCPICRDEYLILDYRNVELLKQFMSSQSGDVICYSKTGLCQVKNRELLVAIRRALDFGYLTFDLPFRQFDYEEYFGENFSNA